MDVRNLMQKSSEQVQLLPSNRPNALSLLPPPTKLREGNVFTRLILFRVMGISRQDPSPGLNCTVPQFSSPPPCPCPGLWPWQPYTCSNKYRALPLQTCSHVFSLDLTVNNRTRPCFLPTLDTFKSGHFEAQAVGKWAVGIRLKCLLVLGCKARGRWIFDRTCCLTAHQTLIAVMIWREATTG